MARRFTRRGILKRSAGVAAGTAGAVAFADGLASGSSGPGARIGQVVRVNGAAVEVALDGGGTATVPPVGFPAGWRLRPGDPIMVMKAEFHGVPDHASPLVTSITGTVGRERGRRVSVDGQPVHIVAETIQTSEETADGSHVEAFCIRNRQENSLTAVALRFVS